MLKFFLFEASLPIAKVRLPQLGDECPNRILSTPGGPSPQSGEAPTLAAYYQFGATGPGVLNNIAPRHNMGICWFGTDGYVKIEA